MTIREIEHNSAEYQETITLRDYILRKPLGLQYSQDDLDAEHDSYHLSGYDEFDKVLACLVLKPLAKSKDIKMRQVAVRESQQGKGVGKALVDYSELFSKEKGFERIVLHAREVAVPFYKRLNYQIVGERFEEVGIPHYKMEKII